MSQQIDRALAAQFGREALMIGEQGHYTTSTGKTVDIQPMISKALSKNFRGIYKRVVFAVLDWSPDRRFIGPFEQIFKNQ